MTEIDTTTAKRVFPLDDGPDVDDYAESLARIQNEFLRDPDTFESEVADLFGPGDVERVCTTEDWVGYKVEDIKNVWPAIKGEVMGLTMPNECKHLHERAIEEELGRVRMFGHGEEAVVVFK